LSKELHVRREGGPTVGYIELLRLVQGWPCHTHLKHIQPSGDVRKIEA
jgi:hypothetical protein